MKLWTVTPPESIKLSDINNYYRFAKSKYIIRRVNDYMFTICYSQTVKSKTETITRYVPIIQHDDFFIQLVKRGIKIEKDSDKIHFRLERKRKHTVLFVDTSVQKFEIHLKSNKILLIKYGQRVKRIFNEITERRI